MDSNGNTLIDFRYKQHFKAPKGRNGQGKNKTGKSLSCNEIIDFKLIAH